jgi:hypothetical protein
VLSTVPRRCLRKQVITSVPIQHVAETGPKRRSGGQGAGRVLSATAKRTLCRNIASEVSGSAREASAGPMAPRGI